MSANSTIRPELADVYFTWDAQAAATTTPSTGGTLAVPATSNWGPINTVVSLTSFDAGDGNSYVDYFGTSDTPLARAVKGAFKGQGYNGQGGAGTVLAYRQANANAAPGAHTLQNTAGSPVPALTLTAKYDGTRASSLRVTVQDSAVTGQDELLLLDGSLVIEKYDYPQTDIGSLADLITEFSDFLVPTLLVDGVALAHVSSVTLPGGVDGNGLVGQDWTNTFAAFDLQRWQYFPAYGVTDPTIRASIVAWIQTRNSNSSRCMAMFGGASDELLSTAIARSAAINDYDIINLGEGTLHLTDDNRDCSTAEFVTRYAGARAWRGESRGDIFVRFADVELVSGASLLEQQTAKNSGVVVFSRDTDASAPVFIREAVNTYTDDSQSPVDAQGVKMNPVALYSVIKNIAIQQGIELEVGDWARGGEILGALPVNDKNRQLVLGRVTIAYSNREKAQVVQPGWSVAVAGTPSDDDDFIQYVHGFHPTRSLRQIFNLARVG